jgi:AraC-like DNA-binding protein
MEPNDVSSKAIFYSRQLPVMPLNNFIEYYIYREIRVKEGNTISKFMPCRHSNSIDFYIGERYDTFDVQTGKLVPFVRCTIRGPRTFKKYQIRIQGNFRSFSIKFKPAGIYHLLGIPMDSFCDEAIDACLIHPVLFHKLTESLMACDNIHSCVSVIMPFLIHMLNDFKQRGSVASKLAELMLMANNSVSVNTLQKQLPLSIRQIERNFIKEIGVSPKTFSSMIRFEKMIHQRILQPQRKWTELAYEHNYFDQTHLIKDFHKFLDINPRNFSPEDFAF